MKLYLIYTFSHLELITVTVEHIIRLRQIAAIMEEITREILDRCIVRAGDVPHSIDLIDT